MIEQPVTDSSLQYLLKSDETLLWIGAPPGGIYFRSDDWIKIPITSLWLAVSVAGELLFLYQITGWDIFPHLRLMMIILPLIGAYFLAVAFYACIGRLIWDWYCRTNTTYAVTNHRLLIHRKGKRATTWSFDLRALPFLQMNKGCKGYGTLSFSTGSATGMLRWTRPAPRFEHIPNAQKVFNLIQSIRA